jgi:hypothetical protein
MALSSSDACERSLAGGSVIEASLLMLRMRRSSPKGWPQSSASFWETYSDSAKCRRKDLQLSDTMTWLDFERAASELILQTYGIEIRKSRQPKGEPAYVFAAVCLINDHLKYDGASAIVRVTDQESWRGALQLMQATRGKIAIVFRFGKGSSNEPASKCTMQ